MQSNKAWRFIVLALGSNLHIPDLIVHKYKIEDRRRRVASMLAQSMTETDIARELKVDQSTISRDIKVLKKLSQQFVYDLAKSDFLLLQAVHRWN